MARQAPALRRFVNLDLACSCGSTLRGPVPEAVAAMQIRDVFLSFHRTSEHTITEATREELR